MERTVSHREAGATILEIVVALGVVVLSFSGIFVMNSRVLSLLRGSLESTASNRVLNDRAEQLRGSTWQQITDATHYSGTVFALPPDSAGALANLTESITVTAPDAAPGTVTPIAVHRTPAGSISTTSLGDPALRTQPSVRVDISTSWLAKGGRTRLRQLSLYFGEGGVSGRR
jgi:hypothetical protein